MNWDDFLFGFIRAAVNCARGRDDLTWEQWEALREWDLSTMRIVTIDGQQFFISAVSA